VSMSPPQAILQSTTILRLNASVNSWQVRSVSRDCRWFPCRLLPSVVDIPSEQYLLITQHLCCTLPIVWGIMPRARVLSRLCSDYHNQLHEQNIHSGGQEILHIPWNPQMHSILIRARPPLVPVLSNIHLSHPPPVCFLILPSTD
jgi:hypothetical protein